MPLNSTMDDDTFRYALRAPHGARHRGRYVSLAGARGLRQN
jgi:hypothetical protein